MMDISKALKIHGFMTELELETLAKWASTSYHILELGSFMGRSTRALADNTPGKVYAVDDFVGLRERDDNPSPEDIRKAFHDNLVDHIATGKVSVLTIPHNAPILKNASVDMCFIDGSHDFDSVVHDISLCNKIASKLICGHDFDVAHPDVMNAVDILVPGYRVIPGTTLWYVWRAQ